MIGGRQWRPRPVPAQGGEWGTEDAVAHMLSTAAQLGYFEGEPG
jgi:hypothetical protein